MHTFPQSQETVGCQNRFPWLTWPRFLLAENTHWRSLRLICQLLQRWALHGLSSFKSLNGVITGLPQKLRVSSQDDFTHLYSCKRRPQCPAKHPMWEFHEKPVNLVSVLTLLSQGFFLLPSHLQFYDSRGEVHLAAGELIGEIKDIPCSITKCQAFHAKLQPAVC